MRRRVIISLGSLLADAQERGLVAQNVVRSLRSSRKGKKHTERREKAKLRVGVDIPTPDEIRRIVAHLKGRWRPLLRVTVMGFFHRSCRTYVAWTRRASSGTVDNQGEYFATYAT
jgi:integrase